MNSHETWPPLPLEAWRDTCTTLHMWTQVIGKVALALTPLTNHHWNVAFHFTPRGLATLPMQAGERMLTATFDFVDHRLVLHASDGAVESIALVPRTVADFHAAVMGALERLHVKVRIRTMPVEVADPIPFERDTRHRAYDAAWAQAFWRALVSMRPVFEAFRCGFVGKCSPLHFFWGSFDLALTRFSGRRAPPRPDADPVTREAYSHEVISHGFWPGGAGVDEPAFYAYAAPEPEGFDRAAVKPAAARYEPSLREFILPYEAVRTAAAPERDLMDFLQGTYEAGASLGRWDRAALER
ncbi:MAG TPA: DUF5996 family protein [Usitatibacter sp.]|nr:DUF5996 family protein [Usitatibacter sp.]